MTLQYIQVLIGLFCSDSIKGSYCPENFKKTINNLIGFNKSVFICQICNRITINFNIFNLLIFSLESSNYYNLAKNNNSIPIINFDHCFGFLSKEENFQDIYCQKCAKHLNRGKGNIFNCHVQIPEKFNSSNFIEKNNQNDEYELIGIVSHFGESGIGGILLHFASIVQMVKRDVIMIVL